MHDAATRAPARFRRRRGDAVAVVAGLAVLGAGMLVVRDGDVPQWEERLFGAINGLPDALYRPLWPFQQVGAIVVGPLVAVVALACLRPRLAVAALLATLAKLRLERVVKVMVVRFRPAVSVGSVRLRGDVNTLGQSFVSGHAVLVAALAGIVTPYLPGRWKVVPWVLAGLALFTRVYVAAHLPLDVVCGAGLGLAIAGVLNLLFGVPTRTTSPRRTE